MSYYGNNYGGGFGGFISSLPPVTKNIVAINVLVFIATLVNQQFMVANFAMFYPTSPFFRPDYHPHVYAWRILAYLLQYVFAPDVRNRVGKIYRFEEIPDILFRDRTGCGGFAYWSRMD